MYEVVCSKELKLESIDTLIKDYMDIMKIYNKGVIILDLSRNKLYLNDIAEIVFDLEKGLDKLFNFIKGMENNILFDELNDKKEYEIYEKEELNLKVSFRLIKEKRETKYIIYTIEELSLNDLKLIISDKEKDKLDELIGESESIVELKKTIKRVAKSNTTILLYGDTGIGKDFCARLIHSISLRGKEPFVVVDCGSIPETLIESELFGYEGGAFTGANQKGKKGMFELANKGTLCLDEIENAS